jgi:hypothetical protein
MRNAGTEEIPAVFSLCFSRHLSPFDKILSGIPAAVFLIGNCFTGKDKGVNEINITDGAARGGMHAGSRSGGDFMSACF